MKYNEIRLDESKSFDDIAIDNLHLEDMNGKNWWLGIYREVKDKRFKKGIKYMRTSFFITSKSKITVSLQDNQLNTKIIPWNK